jgi:hypothetical protein
MLVLHSIASLVFYTDFGEIKTPQVAMLWGIFLIEKFIDDS